MEMENAREAGWLPVSGAAKYVGVSPVIIRRAIAAGELIAYQKPYTCGPKEGAARRNVLVRISVGDIDEWIRSTWPETGVNGEIAE